MGKYDFLLKFLGKEHQFTPEQINDDLRNVERAPVEDNEEEESVPTNSSFDLDSFINPSGGGSSSLDDLDEIPIKTAAEPEVSPKAMSIPMCWKNWKT